MLKATKSLMTGIGATLASLTIASTASAASFSYTGTGFSVPDNNPTGITSSIIVPDNVTISDLTIDLNTLIHTYMGDLIATLTHVPSGISVDLFNRIRRTGGTGFGDSSDFNGTYSFNNGFTGNMWTTADSLDGSQNIPTGNYFPTTVNGAISSLAAFNSLTSATGTWTLKISDNTSDDIGSLGSWDLNITGSPVAPVSVPEPASLFGLMGVAAFGVTLKRKKKVEA